MRSTYPSQKYSNGFSLTEVILAVGVIAVSILALLGLFGPTMTSVRDVVDSNEANGVRTRLNAALMSDEIYNNLSGVDPDDTDKFGTFAMNELGSGAGTNNRAPKMLYFWNTRSDYENRSPAVLTYSDDISDFQTDFTSGNIEGGAVYVVALEQGMQGGTNSYEFTTDFIDSQGYFPILVSIYSVEPAQATTANEANLRNLVNTTKPLFSYTTAKLR